MGVDRLNCIVIENDILEFLDEIETQLSKKLVCCKCTHPCDGSSRCAMAMKNLLTDLSIFDETYRKQNELAEKVETSE